MESCVSLKNKTSEEVLKSLEGLVNNAEKQNI